MSYEKQTWYDDPSGGTPLTADKMNHIEDGIEELDQFCTSIAPIVLYDSESGTKGAINLSESAANFDELTFYYHDDDGLYDSVSVPDPDGKVVSLTSTAGTSIGNLWFSYKGLAINDTSCTPYQEHHWGQLGFDNGGSLNRHAEDKITVVKVTGVKR